MDVSNAQTPLKYTTQLWDDTYLNSLAQEFLLPHNPNIFWEINPNTKEVETLKNKHLVKMLNNFFPAIGVRNLVLGKELGKHGKPTQLVFHRGNRVEELDEHSLQEVTFSLLNKMGDIGAQVRGELHFHRTKIFQKDAVRSIPDLENVHPFVDTADSAFRFFENGWLEITQDGVSSLKSYEELPDGFIVWNSSVIPRDYVEPLDNSDENKPDTHYRDFIRNLALDETNNVIDAALTRLEYAIGFLCHRHHNEQNRRYVVLVDKFYDGAPNESSNGGNGKSLLVKTLGCLMNDTMLDGRAFKKGKDVDVLFAPVTYSTELVHIDDANKNFPTACLFTRTTGDFFIHRKYQNPFSIPADISPKIVVTSNFPLPDDGGNSFTRREFIVEVGNFYRLQSELYEQTPYHLHGNKLLAKEGEGWTDADWSEFYKYVFECISKYIALRTGLPIGGETEYYQRASCIQLVKSEALFEYLLSKLNTYWQTGEEVFVAKFYQEVRYAYPEETKYVSNKVLWGWFSEIAKAHKKYPNRHRNGTLETQRLSEDRWDRWIGEGMSDWADENGNKPEKINGRVQVFRISSITKPNLPPPSFNKNPIQKKVAPPDANQPTSSASLENFF